jgi:2-phosphoglycerate kinase
MRIQYDDVAIPYPVSILRGYLRLLGLSRIDSLRIVESVISSDTVIFPSEEKILEECNNILIRDHPKFSDSFNVILEYNRQLRKGKLPHILLAISGASATGKSMLAINMIHTLAATRVVSTDSIRQILRTQTNESNSPELFCHTYQVHHYKQVGSVDLPLSVRGYLAQMEAISPALRSTVLRLVDEGVSSIIEGVHIIPGTLRDLESSIIEILIHPDDETHWGMFLSKSHGSGLKTVSADKVERRKEYEATREIQDFLRVQAKKNTIPIICLESYENAEEEINRVIFDHIARLVKGEV